MGAIRLAGARWAVNGMLLVTLALSGCGVAGPATTTAPVAAPSTKARTLVVIVGREPATVAARALVPAGAPLRFQQRLVNALLALIDGQGLPQPELLASLPALNTASWQVFPDGTMQTAYALRPNLTWHDGQPLTSGDFVFAWRVYGSPEIGLAGRVPMIAMSDVTAIDREHFMIKWKQPYPDADSLSYYNRELSPLPQHILGPAFDNMATTGLEPFANHPYWTREYVGLGPYRIQRWESGSFIDAVRFDGYALGAPKIARIEMRFSGGDQNVVTAGLLSGDVHVAASGALDDTEVVAREWARTNAGRILNAISVLNYGEFQKRPELATPTAILDPRMRRAIAHAVDKQTLVDTIFGGRAVLTDTPIWTGSAWGAAVDDSIPTYRHDLRATESLMNQVGFRKGPDGFYAGADGPLLPLELVSTASQDQVQEVLVISDWLKTAGFGIEQRVIPAARAQDNEVRSTYPGLLINNTSPGEQALQILASTAIPSASNRWVGQNRGGWVSPDYDRLLDAFNTTLDRGERVRQVRQMLQIYSEELPFISIVFNLGGTAAVAELKGLTTTAPETNTAWNIHEWEFQ